MLEVEFLIDNIFVVFTGKAIEQMFGILMCAIFIADIFLYLYEAEFIRSLLSDGKKWLASQFFFTY